MGDIRNQIEAILFASGKKVDIQFIKEVLELDNIRPAKKALNELKEWYDKNSEVLMITQDEDKWKINVREKYSDVVRKIVSETDFSKATLETLSVIAWKSPAVQSDIVDIRSSAAYDHIAELEKAGFITKERHGRSYILKVTNKFFEYFDIEGADGIKEVFKKIKEAPPQKKVEDFKEEKIGDLEVVEVKPEPEKIIDEDAEMLGKLEVYDDDKLESIQKRVDDIELDKPEYELPKEEESDEERTKEIVHDLLDDSENTDEDVHTPLDIDESDLKEEKEQ